MAKKDKVRRPRAEPPRGFRDTSGDAMLRREAMLARIAAVYRLYGFDPLETPAVETVEALGKFLPDVDRPNEGVFAWQEAAEGERGAGGDWLALRYDLTAPLARFYAQNRNDLPTPYRRYAMGPVWRNEKPGPGRYRQFTQCDADTVGAASVAADAEICMMLADALEAAGIARGDYVIRINSRKILNGVLEVAGLPEEAVDARAVTLRAIDKIDRLGAAGVRALLGAGRRDDSGDFTEGAGLSDPQIATIMGFVEAFDRVDDGLGKEAEAARSEGDETRAAQLQGARDAVRHAPEDRDLRRGGGRSLPVWNRRMLDYLDGLVTRSDTGLRGVEELRALHGLIDTPAAAGRFQIDPSVVRGLGYYTGPVYEAELLFQVLDDKGRPQRFGSVAGGGRYDDLVTRFTGQAVPATGVSIGVDRLLAALDAQAAAPVGADGPVVVTVMDRDRMADYQAMAAELRGAGIRAEVYLGNPKNFGNQLKYADRRGSPVAVIAGADEAAAGVVQVKDLVLGARIAARATLDEWRDRPSQVEVPRADLVATVRGMLAGAAPPSGGRMTEPHGQGQGRDRPGRRADDRAVAERLCRAFADRGATRADPDILLPAGTLLDLYGEDIRARAYVTIDPDRGEAMLRPDFTVPIVQMHLDRGGGPARYTYAGEVFRKQQGCRPVEFLQAGFELFGGDPAAAEAEVFAAVHALLAPLGLVAAIGDIGLLRAAVAALSTSDRRKAALQRHLWHPARFRALLARFRSDRPAPRPAGQADALPIGLRTVAEIDERLATLAEDAQVPPLSPQEAAVIDTLLGIAGPVRAAHERLAALAREMPALAPAVARFAARLEAFAAAGIDTATLQFEASYGRTTLEYYDGFVFGFALQDRPDLPPVATGGRYDALTRALGGDLTAVGGAIRAGMVADLVRAR